MPRGGYRQPSNPAPVSGPGAHSRRTDGQPMRQLANADYGEQAAYQQIQQGAPLAQAAQSVAGASAPQVDPLAGLTGLDAPSGMPDVPVTAGADLGAGPGMDALGMPRNLADVKRADAQRLLESGAVQAMVLAAQAETATPSFRRYVRNVLASL
jgi:hypothetical protein